MIYDDIEIPNAAESKEIAECTMTIRNVATVFNTRKEVVYESTNGFISISAINFE